MSRRDQQGRRRRCKGTLQRHQPKTTAHSHQPHHLQAVFLPEATDYLAHNATESLSLCQPTSTSPLVLGLQSLAATHSLPISVGVHEPSSSSPDKLKNTLLWISARGEITNRYQKLHLFDIAIPNGPTMRESASVERGAALPAPFPTPAGKVGPAICFDLRFAELALHHKRLGAEILLYPSAFHPDTGRVHWLPLLQARAVETLCYVVAAAQVGRHNEVRRSYGHSVVVSPWGEVLAEAGGEWRGEPECLVVDVDLEYLEGRRKGLPQERRT